MPHTIEVIEESRMNSICYSVHFGFSALSLSHSSGAWGLGEGDEVRNLLHGVWGCAETAPRGLAEGEGKDTAWRSPEWADRVGNVGMETSSVSKPAPSQAADCKSSRTGICALGLRGSI